jgi:chromosome segregation ATPase
MRLIALRLGRAWFSVAAFSMVAALAASSRAEAPPAPVSPVAPDAAALIVESLPQQNTAETDAALQRRINNYAAAIASGRYLPGMLANTQGATRKTHWFQDAADPRERADWLRQHLRITVLPGTSLVQVALEGVADPADRRTIVEEVCSSFLDGERAVRNTDQLDRMNNLNNVRIKVEARLKDLRSDLRQKQVQLSIEGVAGPRMNVKELQLSRLAQEQVEAQLDVGKCEEAYKALRDAQKNPDTADVDLLVAQVAPFLNQDRHQLRALELDRDLVTEKLGADNEKSKELATRVEKTRASYQAQLQEARDKARAMRLEAAQQELLAAQARLKALTARVDALKEDLGDLSNSVLQLATLQAEEAGLAQQQKEVKEQIVQALVSSQAAAPTAIRWYLHPQEAPAR